MPKHTLEVSVRYSEVDQQGIAHHSSYIPWLEMARLQFLKDLGEDYKKLEQEGVSLVVAELNCRYRRPLSFDDLICIETELHQASAAKLVFHYTLKNEREEVAATAQTILACVNQKGRPTKLPKPLQEKLHGAITIAFEEK